ITDRAFKSAFQFVNPLAGSVFYGVAHLKGDLGLSAVRRLASEVLDVSGALSLLLPIVFLINRDFVALWVEPSSFGGMRLAFLLCCSGIVSARYNLLSMLACGVGNLGSAARANMLEAITRIALIGVLMSVFGVAGAPSAAIVSVSVVSAIELGPSLARVLGQSIGVFWFTQIRTSLGVAATLS